MSVAPASAQYNISTGEPGSIQDAYIRIELSRFIHHGNHALLISVEDSGCGFDHVSFLSDMKNNPNKAMAAKKSGIARVMDLCHSLHYRGNGNKVEVIVDSCRDSVLSHD
jgi:hypothetical protein